MAAFYLLLGIVWILTSDRVVTMLVAEVKGLAWFQTAKGLLFVIATAGLLYLFARHQMQRVLHSERNLAHTQQQFATLLSNIPGMAYRGLHDRERTMLLVSQGCFGVTGHQPEDLGQREAASYGRLIDPNDRERVSAQIERAVAEDQPYELQYRLRTASGATRWVWEQGRAVERRSDGTAVLEGFVMDVTFFIKTRQALEASEQHYRRLIETAAEGVWIVDAGNMTTFVNQRLSQMLGYEPDEMIGRPMFDFFDEEGCQLARRRMEHRRGGVAEQHDAELIRKDGTVLWTLMACSPITNQAGEYAGALAMVSDITDRKRAERLEAERQSLLEQGRLMEEAISVVGHELRTPLASLRAIAEYLLDSAGAADPAQQRDMVSDVHEQTVRMAEMVNNMLESMRLRRGQVTWNWSQVALKEVCQEALDVLRPMVDEQQVRLELEVDPPSLAMAGDLSALRRLVLNLLSNASRHTEAGSIAVRVSDEQGPEGRWIQLEVQDTGQGMPPETLQQLGMALTRSTGIGDAHAASGAGLGLAICKQIAAVHGGTISVRSQPGRGTTFVVRLAADQPAPADAEELPVIQSDAA